MPSLRSSSSLCVLAFACLSTTMLHTGQAQTSASPAKHAAAKPGIVGDVMKLLQAKFSDAAILKKIAQANTPVVLTTDQMIALKGAGASDAVLAALEDPKLASGATTVSGPATVVVAPPPPAPSVGGAPATSTTVTTVTSTTVTKPDSRKRIAVDEFDYSTVQTAVASIFGTNQNIGKGIQSMFVTRIAKEGKVIVVERKKLNQVMGEQDLAASNRVKAGTGAKIGQIRGADAILYGDIVTFGRDDKKKAIAGGGLIGAGIAGIAAARKTDKAQVTIDYRLVDAETSEVIATGEAKGESQRKSSSFAAMAGAFGVGGAGVALDMSSSNFAETIIGEATMDAVNKLAAALDEQLPKLEAKHFDISARVAFVSGTQVTINAGSAQNVSVGDRFQIAHILNEVKDPTTGEVIDLATDKIGVIDITQVKDRVAIGTYSGPGTPKAGDVAEKH